VFLRVALVGAERHFHIAALPSPVPVVLPEFFAAEALGAPVAAEAEQPQNPA
jgi:hypothetical protein